jgi:hypothetical protein
VYSFFSIPLPFEEERGDHPLHSNLNKSKIINKQAAMA